MPRINEVLSPDCLNALLRRWGRQWYTLLRRATYRPEQRYMRGRRSAEGE
jgi:hypothetical protein